jgi:hypothetical protein
MTELPDRLLRAALDDTASTPPSSACMDAATLAAWADGTLTGVERAAVQAHAAGCARCLALLAAMTRIEPSQLKRPWWRSPFAWLPLATVTAAVVIVVGLGVLENQPPVSTGTGSSDSTQLPPSPAAVSPPEAANAPAQPSASAVPSASPASRRRERPGVDAAPPPAVAAEPKREQPVASPAIPPPPAAPLIDIPAATPTATAAATPAAKSVESVPMTSAIAPSAPAPAAPPSAARDEIMRRQDSARAFAGQTMMKAAVPAPIVIASPNRDSQWRIVGGAVEHTVDSGATWQTQAIGVATPMRAGAAPEARVCWVAGAAGVVLRTIDGVTWTRIPFPQSVDLVAIQASDVLHATVTTAAGARFTTSDGGATWIRQ